MKQNKFTTKWKIIIFIIGVLSIISLFNPHIEKEVKYYTTVIDGKISISSYGDYFELEGKRDIKFDCTEGITLGNNSILNLYVGRKAKPIAMALLGDGVCYIEYNKVVNRLRLGYTGKGE